MTPGTGIYWAVLDGTRQCCTVLYLNALGSTGLYWAATGLYWTVMGCTELVYVVYVRLVGVIKVVRWSR